LDVTALDLIAAISILWAGWIMVNTPWFEVWVRFANSTKPEEQIPSPELTNWKLLF